MKINNFTAIPLHISEGQGLPINRQPVTVAVPFKASDLDSVEGCWLSSTGPTPAVYSVKATSHWLDGSVKWAQVKTVLAPATGSLPDLQLQPAVATGSNETAQSQTLEVVQDAQYITINDGELSYVFGVGTKREFPDIYNADTQIWSGDSFSISTVGGDGENLDFVTSSVNVESQDAVSVLVKVRGIIAVSSSQRLNVSLNFEVLSGQWLRLGIQIHNPHRAHHEGSLWDLGDEGSINFREFGVRIARNNNDTVKFRSEPEKDWHLCGSVKTSLFQASSGGENWNSPNHIDARGELCNKFKGYRVELGDSETIQGDRATPLVWTTASNGTSWGLKIPQYWQNFPKCLSFEKSSIMVGLFPAEHGSLYELQGGERKHHDIVFSFSDDADSLQWVDYPAILIVPSSTVMESQVLAYSDGDGGSAYDEIIGKSLCADTGILAKREIIDEYGWRNFGEVYADHETLYHDTDELFISHYNNQYDSIYGFGRQYLLTGDIRWFHLMDDLAKHVLDIDIYRTDEDRAEYNHGLFWHTDHYKKAHTCTHRTYSQAHYIDWQGDKGGGPGSEHCYTNGLFLYYQLTGNTDARDAVVGLAGWIRHFYEGTGTVLETLKNIVSTERRKFLSLCKGGKVFKYKYGLDRGTGNYIRALLDRFEITGDVSCLKEVELIIKSTFASNDDLSERNLHNAEYTWFYSIFLQDVVRYLDLKRNLGELDTAFCYARNGLLHYARWMAANEAPFLSKPEGLEYPNDTWIAQDIRKANVLYAAYRYSTENRDEFLTRARFFRDYVLQALAQSDTLHYSRIQIIMLQNHGPSAMMDTVTEPYEGLSSLPTDEAAEKSCFYSLPSFTLAVLTQLAVALRKFSIRREIRWVKTRIG